MRLLIVYGTTEGHTRKIAFRLSEWAQAAGHDVTLVESTETLWPLDWRAFDAVVLAASLHGGRYQTTIVRFARAHAVHLNTMHTAFVSVSLSAASRNDDDVRGLEQCIEEFCRRTGWVPSIVHHASGAFRYTQYGFFKRWGMKYMAWRKGGPTDTSKDWELTDWDALAEFVDDFTQMRRVSHA